MINKILGADDKHIETEELIDINRKTPVNPKQISSDPITQTEDEISRFKKMWQEGLD